MRIYQNTLCGTRSKYVTGCRCVDCVKANTWYSKLYRMQDTFRQAKHGTRTTYTRGCRCVDCKEASRLYLKNYRAYRNHVNAVATY